MIKTLAICLATAVMTAGCTATAPSLQQGPDAEVTYDGLVAVNNSRFARAWIKPDIDLSRYTKIMGGGAEFQFRAAREVSATGARRSNQTEFAISDAGRQKLGEEVTGVFRDELANSKYFELVTEPGPDVLIVEGVLLDIVSFVPPDIVGRGEIYLDRVGEATLVLQLSDSMSGEVLARAAERRTAQRSNTTMTQSTPVTNWAEVRRMARRWAIKLREGLDGFKE